MPRASEASHFLTLLLSALAFCVVPRLVYNPPIHFYILRGSGSFVDVLANAFKVVRSVQADTSFTETVATASAGTATIITGETERTIVSPFVKADSLIYITPVSNNGGQTPYIARQTAENPSAQTKGSFTIQISQNASQDVKVNWWIVN